MTVKTDEIIRPARKSKGESGRNGTADSLKKPSVIPACALNDFHHARKIVEMHGADIRYCRKLGGFLVWDDARWIEDETGEVWRRAIHTAARTYLDARKAGAAEDESTRLRKWLLRAERRRSIEDALKHLQAFPDIVTKADMFDRDPWLFNVTNGTVDLRTGELHEHMREDLITKLAPVTFDPNAAPPAGEPPGHWLQFLDEIFDGNRALIEFLQRACGYALTGVVGEHKLFFLHGGGANGKSTFLDALMHVMGGYARRLAPDLLFGARRDSHPTGLADLKGRRLGVTSEVEFGKKLAEAVVKELTGGDRLTARRMRQDYFEFEPTHKLFMCGNHLPIIRGADHAIWRRIDLIPFTVTIPDELQDKELPQKLRAEATGILNWLVEGCLEWQSKGLAEPAEVTAATRSYRSDMDVLGDFMNDCCVLDPGAHAMSADLNRVYREWCAKNGEAPMSVRRLGLRLKERGFRVELRGNKRLRAWIGIGLREKSP